MLQQFSCLNLTNTRIIGLVISRFWIPEAHDCSYNRDIGNITSALLLKAQYLVSSMTSLVQAAEGMGRGLLSYFETWVSVSPPDKWREPSLCGLTVRQGPGRTFIVFYNPSVG